MYTKALVLPKGYVAPRCFVGTCYMSQLTTLLINVVQHRIQPQAITGLDAHQAKIYNAICAIYTHASSITAYNRAAWVANCLAKLGTLHAQPIPDELMY